VVRIPTWARVFFFFWKRPDRLLGPTSLLFSGFRRFFLGEKWPVLEADQSIQSSAEVKSEWSYISHSILCLYGVCRDYFT
jgi:hypothetical protein